MMLRAVEFDIDGRWCVCCGDVLMRVEAPLAP